MKANLKSASSFTKLLYTHGEKIGMVAIVACAGMLVWSALGVERLGTDREPEGLNKLTQQVSATLEKTRWKSFSKEDVLDADLYDPKTLKAIERDDFPSPKYGMNRSLLAPAGKRTDPMLLAPEDLEVFSDAGLLALADPKLIHQRKLEAALLAKDEEKKKEERLQKSRGERRGNGGLDFDAGRRSGPRKGTNKKEGAIVVRPPSSVQLGGFEEITATPWVVVLAKIPIQLQNQHFEEALLTARGYVKKRDIPYYLGYRVERALVTAQGQQPWKPMQNVSRPALQPLYAKYPFNPAGVIDKKYKHPLLTQRLLPLLLYQWDRHVSHSSMPLLSERNLYGRDTSPNELDPLESATEGDDSEFKDPLARKRSRNPQFNRLSKGTGGRLQPPRQNFYEEDEGGIEGGGYPGQFRGGAAIGKGSGVQIDEFIWDTVTPHVLLRYFDRDVQPGHKYRYRIKLVLLDVNYCNANDSTKVKEQYLDKTVIDRKQGKEAIYRATEWSKPSPIASVPMPGRVYLVSSEPAKESKFNDEPKAELLIKVLNSDYSAEISKSEKFTRGSVVNIRAKAEVVMASKFKPENEPEFDFHTGLTLIDFSGGEPLSRKNKMVVPTRAILMDPAGRLMLQTELEDLEPVEKFKEDIEGNEKNRRGGRPQDDGFEGFNDEYDQYQGP